MRMRRGESHGTEGERSIGRSRVTGRGGREERARRERNQRNLDVLREMADGTAYSSPSDSDPLLPLEELPEPLLDDDSALFVAARAADGAAAAAAATAPVAMVAGAGPGEADLGTSAMIGRGGAAGAAPAFDTGGTCCCGSVGGGEAEGLRGARERGASTPGAAAGATAATGATMGRLIDSGWATASGDDAGAATAGASAVSALVMRSAREARLLALSFVEPDDRRGASRSSCSVVVAEAVASGLPLL